VRGALDATGAAGPTNTAQGDVRRNQSRSKYGVRRVKA